MSSDLQLSAELAERIVQYVRAGNSVRTAAAAHGVPARVFEEWWKRGSPDGDELDDEPYRELRERLEVARAEAEVIFVALVSREAQTNYGAAVFMLERQFPDRWARVSQRERHETADELPPPADDPFAEVDELARQRNRRHSA